MRLMGEFNQILRVLPEARAALDGDGLIHRESTAGKGFAVRPQGVRWRRATCAVR